LWLNQQHIMRSTPEHLAGYLAEHLAALGVVVDDIAKLAAVAKAQQERAKTLKEMAANSLFFFRAPEGYDEKAARKNLTAAAAPVLGEVSARLAALPEWTAQGSHEAVTAVATELDLGMGKVAQPIRVAVSGTSVSPPLDARLAVRGREQALARLAADIDYALAAGEG